MQANFEATALGHLDRLIALDAAPRPTLAKAELGRELANDLIREFTSTGHFAEHQQDRQRQTR
jgi:hypothetical protein